MTDLERMARKAGLMQYNRRDWCSEQTDGISAEDLARFADLIRADERERSAVLVEKLTYRARWVSGGMNGAPVAPCALAAAIRAN